MGERVKKEFWYLLVEGALDDEHAAVGNFYGYGEHLGEAVSHVLAAAEKEGFLHARIGEAYFVEAGFEMPDDLVTLNEHVQWSPARYCFPLPDFHHALVLPSGILHAAYESEKDPELIREAFSACGYEKNSHGEYAMDIVAGRDRLKDVFFSFIRLLSDVNGLFFRLMDFWEDRAFEVWAYDESDVEALIALLSSNLPDTIENGYVEIAVTASRDEKKTILILDPHKHISLFMRDENIFFRTLQQARLLGFAEAEDCCRIENGYYHWHYRPAGSRSRDGFIQWLKERDFECTGS